MFLGTLLKCNQQHINAIICTLNTHYGVKKQTHKKSIVCESKKY